MERKFKIMPENDPLPPFPSNKVLEDHHEFLVIVPVKSPDSSVEKKAIDLYNDPWYKAARMQEYNKIQDDPKAKRSYAGSRLFKRVGGDTLEFVQVFSNAESRDNFALSKTHKDSIKAMKDAGLEIIEEFRSDNLDGHSTAGADWVRIGIMAMHDHA